MCRDKDKRIADLERLVRSQKSVLFDLRNRTAESALRYLPKIIGGRKGLRVTINDGIVVLDENKRIIGCNEETLKLARYGGEAVGKNYEEVLGLDAFKRSRWAMDYYLRHLEEIPNGGDIFIRNRRRKVHVHAAVHSERYEEGGETKTRTFYILAIGTRIIPGGDLYKSVKNKRAVKIKAQREGDMELDT